MKILLGIVLLVLVFVGWGTYRNSQSKALGIVNGSLGGCPTTPNCVSSCCGQEDPIHQIEPLDVSGLDAPMSRLEDVLVSISGVVIVTVSDRYIHAEACSSTFRFVDDVEFLYDSEKAVIHVRSASRVGYSDMGVNRRRIEEIRAHLAQR